MCETYGRTFDVRAKPAAEADNMAYTPARLGLHQDLLYLEPLPMLQMLHCLDNSCAGGDSFSDGDRVGIALDHLARTSRRLAPLTTQLVPYGYRANGRNYHAERPVIAQSPGGFGGFGGVYWSPPFQAPYLCPTVDLRPWIAAARVFDDLLAAACGPASASSSTICASCTAAPPSTRPPAATAGCAAPTSPPRTSSAPPPPSPRATPRSTAGPGRGPTG